jgi:hypothetical protein
MMPPEKDSIRATLLEHPRERLYVHPLAWTADHPKHLSSKIHVLEHDPRDYSNIEIIDGIGWQEALGAVANIDGCREKQSKDVQMRCLVQQLSCMAGLRVDRLVFLLCTK